VLIGIAGGTGSGKTSVARSIYDDLGPDKVIIVRQDAYYRDLGHLPAEERRAYNFDHPDAFDLELLLQHLRALLKGGSVALPVYDYVNHCRTKQTEPVGGNKIILLEGILVLNDPALRNIMRIKVYIDTDADVRFIRRLKRDIYERGRSVDSVIAQYEATVRPMHLQFVEPTKRYADVIIPEGAQNHVAVDLLKTKIRAEYALLA
jgi:uridine kinase